MKSYIATLLFSTACLSTAWLTSCNDYLDKYPDNRMDLNTPDKISKLLVSAYPAVHSAYLLEMYSDNTDENISGTWTEDSRFQREAYNWQDITDVSEYESPQELWNSHYLAIATANEAIAAIKSSNNPDSYSAQLGESKLCRAYAMFCLANVFCKAYDKQSADKELGLPYPLKPEDHPGGTYERGTLAELYANIEKDLTEGLATVGSNYTTPKFHFTPDAAHAFAARFYLYKKEYAKAVEHADKVLGESPSAVLRDWALWNKKGLNGWAMPNEYIRSTVKANLLFQVIVSNWGLLSFPAPYGCRYAHGSLVAERETVKSVGPWGDVYKKWNYISGTNAGYPQVVVRKLPYSFKYSDREAGIGQPYSEYPVFTTDETLLVRAEAKAWLKDYAGAVEDINTELRALEKTPTTLTTDSLVKFYKNMAYYRPDAPTAKKAFHTSESLDMNTQEPLLQSILHLRRILTIHEGLRMQDVKRYGITIYRRRLNAKGNFTAVTDSMTASDPRQAVQLPQDVITAGMQPNPRTVKSSK